MQPWVGSQISQNNTGLVVFGSDVTGSTITNDRGIFARDGSLFKQIVRSGDPAPINGNFSWFSNASVNESGAVAFSAVLENTPAGPWDNEGIYRVDGSGLRQIVRELDVAPDGFSAFSNLYQPTINNAGDLAFGSTLINTPGGTSDDTGIFRGNGVSMMQIAREGQLAPDGNGTFSDLATASPEMNQYGKVAFSAFLNGTAANEGVFVGDGGAISQIARTGQAAPDGNGMFENLAAHQINSSGDVSFLASLAGTGTVGGDAGLFVSRNGTLNEVARIGNAAPNAKGEFTSFGPAALNESGTMAFWALAQKPGNLSSTSGLYLGDGRDLVPVIHEGDFIDGSTVQLISFATGVPGGPQMSGLNDHGQVAFTARLADGRDVVQMFTPDLWWRGDYGGSWDNSDSWTLGLSPASMHNVLINPNSNQTIWGPTNDTNVQWLQIGGGNGDTTLYLTSGAALTATNGVAIGFNGTLTGDGILAGAGVTNQGTILASDLIIAGNLTNYHVIRGTGSIDSYLFNSVSGQIRADSGESLHLGGPTTINAGLIRVIGGELIVDGQVQNQASTGLITARNGTMEFRTGLVNDGSMGISFGTTDIFGDVVNNPSGIINVSGGANATFYDDVIQNGTLQVVAVGNTTSTAVFFGELSGTGGFTGGGDVYALGDLRPGASPASVLMDGNLFLGAGTQTQIELGGLGIGEFDQLVVTGDLSLGGALFLDLIDGHLLTFNDEYLIADVGGLLTGEFAGLVEGDLVGNFGGMDLFITYAAGNGNDVALFTPVPEPSMVFLLVTLCVAWLAGRRLARHQTDGPVTLAKSCQRPASRLDP